MTTTTTTTSPSTTAMFTKTRHRSFNPSVFRLIILLPFLSHFPSLYILLFSSFFSFQIQPCLPFLPLSPQTSLSSFLFSSSFLLHPPFFSSFQPSLFSFCLILLCLSFIIPHPPLSSLLPTSFFLLHTPTHTHPTYITITIISTVTYHLHRPADTHRTPSRCRWSRRRSSWRNSRMT